MSTGNAREWTHRCGDAGPDLPADIPVDALTVGVVVVEQESPKKEAREAAGTG
jgi:hypothetical protein